MEKRRRGPNNATRNFSPPNYNNNNKELKTCKNPCENYETRYFCPFSSFMSRTLAKNMYTEFFFYTNPFFCFKLRKRWKIKKLKNFHKKIKKQRKNKYFALFFLGFKKNKRETSKINFFSRLPPMQFIIIASQKKNPHRDFTNAPRHFYRNGAKFEKLLRKSCITTPPRFGENTWARCRLSDAYQSR